MATMHLPLALLSNAAPSSTNSAVEIDSVFDMILNGGPLMIPIALCSVIAIAFVVERSIRLRDGELGSLRLGKNILTSLESGGPEQAIRTCDEESKPLGRILRAGLSRFSSPVIELEKAVEDAGAREVKRLNANLKPLLIVAMITPLLGLLGTVYGMIEAFSNIALQDGLGKPELLASGISQALITTAAGLSVAIPTQAAHFWLRGRVDRFVRRAEDLFLELEDALDRFRAPAIELGGVDA
jgi:biopolymer transport protein ExbB